MVPLTWFNAIVAGVGNYVFIFLSYFSALIEVNWNNSLACYMYMYICTYVFSIGSVAFNYHTEIPSFKGTLHSFVNIATLR